MLFLELRHKWLSQLNKLSINDPAICPNMCGRKYKGLRRKCHLKRHLINECGVPKKFQCHLCLKRFAQNDTLKSHLVMVHKQIPLHRSRFYNDESTEYHINLEKSWK